MTLELYQVDAFAQKLFQGNPAAVVPLKYQWLTDKQMQLIAEENQLSETAFILRQNNEYGIRWFTPQTEVSLCGHATLAAAYVLKTIFGEARKVISFNSLSGRLGVSFETDWIFLNFPTAKLQEFKSNINLSNALGIDPKEYYESNDDLLVVYDSEETIKTLKPNFSLLEKIKCRGVICTAPSKYDGVDFVSRFFAPRVGVNEDPVTGSAHTKLIPYWSEKLKQKKLVAKQLSSRGGTLKCEHQDNRVIIGGQASLYLKGKIEI